MPIQSFVGRDGSGRVIIAGQEQRFRAASIEDARSWVLELVKSHAAETGEAVHFTANDPEGSWPMRVYPDGTITEAPRPVIAPPPPRQPVPAAYHDVQLDNIEHTVIAPPRPPARPTLVIHPESGKTVRVSAPAVLGRNPGELSGHSRVMVFSPGRECSRNHAVVDVDEHRRLIVTDKGTPNGTMVDGTPIAPNTPTIVPNGARVQLGDAAVRVETLPAPPQRPTYPPTASPLTEHKEATP